MASDWNKLKVVDLKAELKRRGLPQAGRKEELVNRLTEADANQADSEAPAEDDVGGEPAQPSPPDQSATKSPPETVVLPPAETTHSEEQLDALATATEAKAPEAAAAAPKQNDEPTAETSLPEESSTASSLQKESATDLPTAPSAEVIQDVQKRKRRSGSPPPSNRETPHKRLRTDDLPEDGHPDAAMPQTETLSKINGTEAAPPSIVSQVTVEPKDERKEVAPQSSLKDNIEDQEEQLDYGADSPIGAFGREPTLEASKPHKEESSQAIPHSEKVRLDNSAVLGNQPPVEDERDVEPSLHPATSALYITGLMRPLRAPMVEQHLVELSTPRGYSPDPSLILDFYLDQIRTHAFVQFKSISAASRVRTALHNQVWPDERNRKALWVDFIPPEKIAGWIETEQTGGGGRNALNKWEISYENNGDNVVANLQEAGADKKPMRSVPHQAPKLVPTGPSRAFPGIEAAPSGPKGFVHPSRLGNLPVNRPSDIGHFRTTRSRPPLNFQPVPEELVRRRVDNIHKFVSRQPNRDLGRENNRYTFEAGDSFVDRGREVFEGIRPPHRERERRGNTGGPPFRPPRDRFGGGRPRRDDYRPPPRSNDFRFDRPIRDSYRDRR